MLFRSHRARKKVPIIAAITTVILGTTIFAPSSFGSSLATLWVGEPIVLFVPPVVAPGDSLDCAIAFEEESEEAEEPIETGVAPGVWRKVAVYSDPPGFVYHDGFISSPNDTISASVSTNATPGPVTVYVKVGESEPVRSNTMVVAH